MDVRGQRATVMGLGRFGGGAAAARFLAECGAEVTITDLLTAEQLGDALALVSDVSVGHWRLGEHRLDDFCGADLVVVNPAVKPDNPFVAAARDAGAVLTSELELFLRACPSRQVIGVTGSNGKSTTAAMTAGIFKAAGRRAWLGGNIGISLLDCLPDIGTDDVVVLEMSSFQLARVAHDAPWPAAAIVTNCTPNHLDWHPSWGAYRAAKQRLLQHLPECGAAIFDPHDVELAGWCSLVRGRIAEPFEPRRLPKLFVPGEHNRRNAALAARAAAEFGVPEDAIRRGLAMYAGLPHRLELVAEHAGQRFYNDSKATTPEAVAASLAAFDEPVWLLAGGVDKRNDLQPLAAVIAGHCAGAALFGQCSEQLLAAIRGIDPGLPAAALPNLDDAFGWCTAHSTPGEVVLLSPGCASFDQYANYSLRGIHFSELARGRAAVKS